MAIKCDFLSEGELIGRKGNLSLYKTTSGLVERYRSYVGKGLLAKPNREVIIQNRPASHTNRAWLDINGYSSSSGKVIRTKDPSGRVINYIESDVHIANDRGILVYSADGTGKIYEILPNSEIKEIHGYNIRIKKFKTKDGDVLEVSKFCPNTCDSEVKTFLNNKLIGHIFRSEKY